MCWPISQTSRTIRYVRLVSLMDHAPGQRQFQTMDQYIFYYQKKRGIDGRGLRANSCEKRLGRPRPPISTPHRIGRSPRSAPSVASPLRATTTRPLAHVDEAIGNGVRLAEFPTSFEAAKASHAHGMSVLMGAPNIVRGKSHSGNIAARDLAERGVLDVLSSDYVPFSLLYAPFMLADEVESHHRCPQAHRAWSPPRPPARSASLIAAGSLPACVPILSGSHREEGVPVDPFRLARGRARVA